MTGNLIINNNGSYVQDLTGHSNNSFEKRVFTSTTGQYYGTKEVLISPWGNNCYYFEDAGEKLIYLYINIEYDN